MTAPQLDTQEHEIPDDARLILVPVANPDTANQLLRLAAQLAHNPESRVVALSVSLGNAEAEAATLEALEPVMKEMKEEGLAIEVQTVTATTIARGILDTIREIGADLVILGIRQRQKGQVVLGTVVENVLDTAPCDVLIYRTSNKPDYNRVIIPIHDNFQAQVAARTGIRLARRQHCGVEAVVVQSANRSFYEGQARIERVLRGLPRQEMVRRTILTGQDMVATVLTRTHKDDLIIIGFSDRPDFESWMFGNLAEEILNRAEGPVIMVSRSQNNLEPSATRLMRRFMTWIRPELTRVEEDELSRQAERMANLDIDYMMLILVSATLATLGLMLNSSAVIIGAMLVAPLMSPLIGFSIGMVIARVKIARQALSTLLIGFLTAILVAVVLGGLLPINTPTAEMLARGSPGLIDAAVALASGVVGAYATARKDIPAALAGVAIAAALMPPVCTIGMGIAFRDAELAYGATLLFATNIICIILAGMVVFLWLGMRPHRYETVSLALQIAAVALFLLVAMPVLWQLTLLTHEANQESQITEQIKAVLGDDELVTLEFDRKESPLRILATIRTAQAITPATVSEFQQELSDTLGVPVRLELIVQEVIRLAVEPETTLEVTVPATPAATVTP